MKLIIIYFTLLFCTCLYSQKTECKETNLTKLELSTVEFNLACDEYKKMMETDTYFLHEKMTKSFAEKMNNTLLSAPPNFWDKDVFLNWLKLNIKKTQFKSMIEAEEYIDNMTAISDKMIKENKHLYELISRATNQQVIEIRKPFIDKTKAR